MEEMQRCIQWLRDQVEAAGAEGLVVGLSGGIDSALVGYLIAGLSPQLPWPLLALRQPPPG